jgi:uncharacterized damage-inducible protein DinB
MNTIIKNISDEEWNKPFPSYWKSIHELCSHIFIGDYGWLNRFRTFTDSKKLSNECFEINYNWSEIIFESINEYLKRRDALDEKITVFIDEITDEDLVKIMPWTHWNGNIVEKKLSVYLLHMFNHATHHRAQVSLYLDMLGKENDYSIFFNMGDKDE